MIAKQIFGCRNYITAIEAICKAVEEFAPEYDEKKIFQKIEKDKKFY